MADDDNGAVDRIDPRYDPAFQRGYRADRSRPRPARQRAAAPPPVEQPPGPPSEMAPDTPAAVLDATGSRASDPRAPERRSSEPRASEPRASDQRVADSRASDPRASSDQWRDDDPLAEAPQRFQPPRRTNPYIVALWIIGIGMILGGIGFEAWAQSNMGGGVSYNSALGVPLRVVILNLAYAICGPMIIIGFATVVGLLFLHAVRRSRP